jgi:hypothetical protein
VADRCNMHGDVACEMDVVYLLPMAAASMCSPRRTLTSSASDRCSPAVRWLVLADRSLCSDVSRKQDAIA